MTSEGSPAGSPADQVVDGPEATPTKAPTPASDAPASDRGAPEPDPDADDSAEVAKASSPVASSGNSSPVAQGATPKQIEIPRRESSVSKAAEMYKQQLQIDAGEETSPKKLSFSEDGEAPPQIKSPEGRRSSVKDATGVFESLKGKEFALANSSDDEPEPEPEPAEIQSPEEGRRSSVKDATGVFESLKGKDFALANASDEEPEPAEPSPHQKALEVFSKLDAGGDAEVGAEAEARRDSEGEVFGKGLETFKKLTGEASPGREKRKSEVRRKSLMFEQNDKKADGGLRGARKPASSIAEKMKLFGN